MDNAVLSRRIRRKALLGYAYLVTPGFALLGLALYDAVTADRWAVFAGLFAVLTVFLFYLPLISHFRCANCRRFFQNERLGLEDGETIYKCVACGHARREREWCGLTDIAKASRSLIRK